MIRTSLSLLPIALALASAAAAQSSPAQSPGAPPVGTPAPAPQASPQDPKALEQKLAAFEAELAELRKRIDAGAAAQPAAGQGADVAELERRIDVLAAEIQGGARTSAAPLEGRYGLSPAASKVYASDGVSIGGYGEMLYQNFAGGSSDELDFLRGVLYFGYHFDEHWVFNSELEVEHAAVGEDAEGEVSLEFAYLDYLMRPALNFRGGLMLIPMGFLNEQHEPTTFLSARRPSIEQLIIPTTWRENGVGLHGESGVVSYRLYAVNGFDASGFEASGLREGKQDGSHAKAEDFALVGRFDWRPLPGLLAGLSAYWGDSGQGLEDAGGSEIGAQTTIADAHVEYRASGWRFRALGALAEVDDVAELNAALGLAGTDSIGEELTGYYLELGYDVLAAFAPESAQSLTPFVRWETYDTQADVPTGFASDPANDVDSWTFGFCYQPIPQVALKLDYQDFDDAAGSAVDQWNAAIGYVF